MPHMEMKNRCIPGPLIVTGMHRLSFYNHFYNQS